MKVIGKAQPIARVSGTAISCGIPNAVVRTQHCVYHRCDSPVFIICIRVKLFDRSRAIGQAKSGLP